VGLPLVEGRAIRVPAVLHVREVSMHTRRRHGDARLGQLRRLGLL